MQYPSEGNLSFMDLPIIIVIIIYNNEINKKTRLIRSLNSIDNDPKISHVPVAVGWGWGKFELHNGDLHCITFKEFLQPRKNNTAENIPLHYADKCLNICSVKNNLTFLSVGFLNADISVHLNLCVVK